MKIAVIGGNGQLGSDLVRVFGEHGDDVYSLCHSEIEVSSFESVEASLRSAAAGLIVNTAAMHQVEKCEQQPERAFAVNAIGCRNLALVAQKMGAVLVHISTDYVFDGRKGRPYVEEDLPLPLNVYGNSKLAGEYFVRTLCEKYFILRASALYGQQPCRAKSGGNFVELMLRLGEDHGTVRVVDSEVVSPTPTSQLARQIYELSRSEAYGLYHATTEGSCSWYEFACEIFERAGSSVKVQVAGPDEFPAKVPRPAYSVLENCALKRLGLNRLGHWREALMEYLNARQVLSEPKLQL